MANEAKSRIKINKLLEDSGWRFESDKNGSANIQLEAGVKFSNLGDDFENAETHDKRGHISNAVYHKEYLPEEYVLYKMNRNLLSVISYQYPIEVFRTMVTGLKNFHHIPGHRAVGLN